MTKTNFTLSSEFGVGTLGFQKFTINGYIKNKQVLQTYRYIRFIPFHGSYLQLNHDTTYDWNFNFNNFTALYNRATRVEDGWTKLNETMVLGNGVTYQNNVATEVSFFSVIPEGSAPILVIKGSYETELNFDFFYVQVRVDGVTSTLMNASGTGILEESMSLKDFAGNQKVEIVLGFKSDGAVTMRGVMLDQVKIVVRSE